MSTASFGTLRLHYAYLKLLLFLSRASFVLGAMPSMLRSAVGFPRKPVRICFCCRACLFDVIVVLRGGFVWRGQGVINPDTYSSADSDTRPHGVASRDFGATAVPLPINDVDVSRRIYPLP